jgi:hypothetical protein
VKGLQRRWARGTSGRLVAGQGAPLLSRPGYLLGHHAVQARQALGLAPLHNLLQELLQERATADSRPRATPGRIRRRLHYKQQCKPLRAPVA